MHRYHYSALSVGLYIVPDQWYDMYHDTLQPILDTYHDTNFAIFYCEYTKIVPCFNESVPYLIEFS